MPKIAFAFPVKVKNFQDFNISLFSINLTLSQYFLLKLGYLCSFGKIRFYVKKEHVRSARKIASLSALDGRNIAERRKRLGLSQERLAKALDISGAAMSRMESRQATPRFSRLEELAERLQCHVADLFRNQNSPLNVRIKTIEDMLRPLSATMQEDLAHLLVVAIQMVKKAGAVL